MTVTQDELDDGLIDIARRNHADWFARKHIGDELYAACPQLAELGRAALRKCIMREFSMIDIIVGKKTAIGMNSMQHAHSLLNLVELHCESAL